MNVAVTLHTVRTPSCPGLLAGGLVLLVAVGIAGLSIGVVRVPPADVVRALLQAVGVQVGAEVDPMHAIVVTSLRLPRVLLAMLVGAALSVSGALVQGWFRNPLAEPTLLGVSGGASLAAAVAIVLRVGDGVGVGVPLAAFLGGLVAVALVHRLGHVGGRASVSTLLLAGLAVTAIAGAGTGLLVTVADDDALRDLTFWTLGSVGGATWPMLAWAAPALGLGLVAAMPLARALDALLLGERTAAHLGVDVVGTQRRIAVIVAWLVGVSVAATGLIGFLGLLGPHVVRMVTGPRHHRLLPAAALFGAILLAAADLAARTVAAPVELPIGVLTTLLGGPVFLSLLLRRGGGLS